MLTRISFSFLMTALLLAGCGSSSTPSSSPAVDAAKSVSEANPSISSSGTLPPAESTPSVSPVTTNVTRTPEEVSRLAVQSLIDAQPEKFWSLLPPSYQSRLNRVVQSWAILFADQEMLTAYANVLKEVASLMKDRQEFFLATPSLPFHAQPEKAKAKWDDLVARINRVADSEVFDSLSLRKFDGGRFCAGPAADLISIYNEIIGLLPDDPLTKLQRELNQAEFKVIEATDQTMTLSLSMGDAADRLYQYERVEGHWIPQPFVVTFDGLIKRSEDALHQFPKDETRRSIAALTGQAEGYLEYLKGIRAVQTQEEFNREMENLILMLVPLESGHDAGNPVPPAVE